MTTYGEKLVDDLLKKLVKRRKDYYYIPEPIIGTPGQAHQHPDFVILSAKLGVIVLEVKDWVKIREINQREVIVERRSGEIVTEPNPVRVARAYALNLEQEFMKVDALVKKFRGKPKLRFPWIHAAAFPRIDCNLLKNLKDQRVWGDGYVFGREDLTETGFEVCLDAIRAPWKLERPLDNEIREKIRAVLDPHIILPDAVGIETVKQTAIIREPLKIQDEAYDTNQPLLPADDLLTREASELAENMSVRLIRGVAGSGKSLVLARRAQYLANQYPHLRILVMAFNKDLTKDLGRRIPGSPNLEVKHFHSICHNIVNRRHIYNTHIISIDKWLEENMRHFLHSHDLSPDFVAQEIEWRKELELYNAEEYLTVARDGRGKSLNKEKRSVINQVFDQYMTIHHDQGLVDWSDLPRLALAELQQGHPMRSSYNVILIDEAQDFAPSWIAVVKKLLKSDGTLFMCDDPAQSLFRSFSWRQKGVEVVGRTRILRVPFRCTKEITLAAHSLISGDKLLGQSEDITEPDLRSYELGSGNPPTLASCRDVDQEVKMVEQIALSIADTGVDPQQIAILCHSKRIVWRWAHLKDKGFYVASFNQMKGLEFRAVLIPHLNTAFDQSDTTKDDGFISETRRRIFTAMTRARETLVLSYHGSLPQELKLIEPYVEYENRTDYGRLM